MGRFLHLMNAIKEQRNQPARTGTQTDGHRNFVIPPANISATAAAYLVELEMPGVTRDELEITVEGNELTIIGRRKLEAPEGEMVYRESPFADYRRVFELGPDVDTTKVKAEIEQGVLKLHLPKSEKAKPRKIEVQVG
jgi:HSP20 family protein